MSSPNMSPNGQTFIVSAVRTPIGKFGGALAGVPATELGGVAIRPRSSGPASTQRPPSSTTR